MVTKWPIVTMSISYDSTRAITVTKEDDRTSYIKMYDLDTNELTFEEKIGGQPDQYIKVKEVEQNAAGKEYACVYFDDGIFKMRTFGKTTRSEEEIKKNEVNFNKLFGINDYTMANGDFQDPFITCTWVGDDKIYVNFFHNHSKTHYHFLWHVRDRRVIGVKPEEGDASGA